MLWIARMCHLGEFGHMSMCLRLDIFGDGLWKHCWYVTMVFAGQSALRGKSLRYCLLMEFRSECNASVCVLWCHHSDDMFWLTFAFLFMHLWFPWISCMCLFGLSKLKWYFWEVKSALAEPVLKFRWHLCISSLTLPNAGGMHLFWTYYCVTVWASGLACMSAANWRWETITGNRYGN